MGGGSVYANCIFVDNDLEGGLKGTVRYALDLQAGAKVSKCLFRGIIRDPQHSVSARENVLNAPPPRFNENFVPQGPEYESAGYRPASGDAARPAQNR